MQDVTVLIGSVVGMSGGGQQDTTKEVVFTGEELASCTEYGYSDRTGGITDTRE